MTQNHAQTIDRLNPTRLSITWKVFIPVAGIVLGAILGYAYVGLRSAETQLLQKTVRSGGVLATMIERAIRPAVLERNEPVVQRLITDLQGLPDLEGLRVLDPDGSVWIGRGQAMEETRVETAPLRQQAIASANGAAGEFVEDRVFHIVRVIRRSDRHAPDDTAGFLEMDLSVQDTQNTIRAGRFQLAVIGLITLVTLAAALMIVLNVLVGWPLAGLTEAMRYVEAGDLTARANIRSGDEFERLAHSFNRMVEEISTKSDQLVEAGQQLLRSEKLASIGLLAAGVAHEINNPVATISMSAEGLHETETSPERKRFLRAIMEESERIGSIVRNLLGFERGGYAAYTPVSLTHILNEAVEDLRWEAERANVKMSLTPRLPYDTILGQEDQIRQACVNIMDNALRAMTTGGRLEIEAEERDGCAHVHFRDTGPGIPEEHQKRIFDPFFTTREVGEGFGLGLAACYEIVKRHDGDITVQSGPEGATFTIELPLMEEEKREKDSLHILLVDDDRSLLDVLSTILELEGHTVVKASSAHEGLLTMRDREFDLVLVDLKMPRTTGLDMLRAIREDSPETKVVIMTAYASVNSTVEAMRLGVFDYLPKPFKLADLRTILERVRRGAKGGLSPEPAAVAGEAGNEKREETE